MTNYLLLYVGGQMPQGDAEVAKVMQAWGAWFQGLGDSVVDQGNPFSGTARTIGADGHVKDGAGSASGYSVIKANSIDDAVAKSKGCPVLLGGATISVYEIHEAM